jgi:hypothetical protein
LFTTWLVSGWFGFLAKADRPIKAPFQAVDAKIGNRIRACVANPLSPKGDDLGQ